MVLVTALDGRRDRLTGLEAGADDFLTKPIDDVALFARVRSLTRLKHVLDELRQREASGRRLGVIEGRGRPHKPRPAPESSSQTMWSTRPTASPANWPWTTVR